MPLSNMRQAILLQSHWRPSLQFAHKSCIRERCLPQRYFCAKSSIDAPDFSADATASAGRNVVSDRRLRQFLRAEVTHFAAMPRKSLTLEDLLHAAASPHLAAETVHQEIPKHFAARIRQISDLEGWSEDPDLKDLHARYQNSFEEFRMTEVDEDLSAFTDVVRNVKARQRQALPLLGNATKRLNASGKGPGREFWNQWLENFLRSRISTEMLTSQYLAIMNQVGKGESMVTGIVDPACDPADLCREVIASVGKLCKSYTGVEPYVTVENRSKHSHQFSYIPVYLRYILLEVLKNACFASARAAMRSSLSSLSDPADPLANKPVSVVISSDDHFVAIRISDVAGGIPFDVGDKVWDFLYSGWSADANAAATPLSGFGLGLPLARLYAQYLGGSLSLVSLPEYGVDAYIFLPRIDVRQNPKIFTHSLDSPAI